MMEASGAQTDPTQGQGEAKVQETPEQRDERLRQEQAQAAQERSDEQRKAEEDAGQESGSPAVTDASTGAEGPHTQAATPESAAESAEEGVTQGLVGEQGAFAGGAPQQSVGGDPNTPVATSAPPPASEANANVRVDEGVEQASTLERSPQEHGAGGS